MSKKYKILIIDDDSGIGEMMSLILEFNGYEVIFSEKTGEAEELVVKNNIDLIILDMLISGVNGTDVCKRIRENEDAAISEIPVLMMSALHQAEIKCKKAGANDFISKPFDMEQLILKVSGLIQNQKNL